MTRRAWWLVVLNFLVPGLPQIVAGNRRLGRLGLAMTVVSWLAIVLALLAALTNRPLLAGIATNSFALWVVQIYLIVAAVLAVLLTVDTLRMVKIIRLKPRTRVLAPLSALVVLGLVVSGLSYGAVQAAVARDVISSVFGDGVVQAPVGGRYNIMLLGGDSGAGRIGLRPDSISVVSVDAATGSTVIIGIPRNLENVPFPTTSPMHALYPQGYDCGNECLINAVYTEAEDHPDLYPDAVAQGSSPGIEATKEAVEGVTGLPIQYFILVNMEGFSSLIDALGGITVDVPTRVELVQGDDGNLQYYGWIEAGTQHMDGTTALWYARSRKTTTDYDRMERQRLIEKAMFQQFSPLTVITKFQALAEAGKATLETDIPDGMIPTLVALAGKAQSQTPSSLELTPANGVITGNPDFAKIKGMVAAAVPGIAGSASASE